MSLFSNSIRRKDHLRDVKINKILITRLDSIGDVVLSTPILKPIKKRYPNAIINYLLSSQSQDIILGNPSVDEVIVYDAPWHFSKGIVEDVKNYLKILRLLRRKKYDLVLDLEGNAKSIFFISFMSKAPVRVSRDWTGGGYLLTKAVPWHEKKHMVEYQADVARAIGVEINDYEPLINLGPKEKEYVDMVFKQNNIKSEKFLSILSIGTRRVTKCWPPERFAEIGDWMIRSFDARIVITGAPNEMKIAKGIRDIMEEDACVLAGKTKSLKQLAAVMERASLVIGNDSGPMHIASAMKTPSISLFSSGLPSEYRPYGNIHLFIQKGNIDCRPCAERKCIRPEGFCMDLITVEDVKEAVKIQIKRIRNTV